MDIHHKSDHKTWHEKQQEHATFGNRVADRVASVMGSWKFIILQTVFVFAWMILNLFAYANHWDPYPFILLNLLFSTQAAYAAPIIMMSQNRQNDRDRHQAYDDYTTNVEAKKEIEELQRTMARIEDKKLDMIIQLLQEVKSSRKT